MNEPIKPNVNVVLDAASRRRRKQIIVATLVTCVAGAMLAGVAHVVKLGAIRVDQIRAQSSYDATDQNEVRKHELAAGEFISGALKEAGSSVYTVARAEALLEDDDWRKLGQEVLIPAGEFIMGTDRKGTDAQDRPQHKITLSAYHIDQYPVTNAQYARFVAETGRHRPPNWKEGVIPSGHVLHPVTMVSWHDAMDYCTWVRKRLPTEAEWEKAARGADGRRWPWGNRMDPKRVNTYYSVGHTTSVFAYPEGASPYGVMDMAGNVSEWTASELMPYQGGEKFTPKPKKAVKGAKHTQYYKVLRGGSWRSDPFSTSAYHRSYDWPQDAADFAGFRCVDDTVEGVIQ